MTRLCGHVYPDGRQCRAPALVNSPVCYPHSPGRAQQRKAAAQKGLETRRRRAETRAAVIEVLRTRREAQQIGPRRAIWHTADCSSAWEMVDELRDWLTSHPQHSISEISVDSLAWEATVYYVEGEE